MSDAQTRDEAVDRLLHRVDREVLEAVNDAFDLTVGLAQVRREATRAKRRRARDTAARDNAGQPVELVLAGAVARKTAIVEEAERLSTIGDEWKDAAKRLDEIAEQWPTIRVDPASEKALWRRLVAARQGFDRSHSPTVVIGPQRSSLPARTVETPAEPQEEGESFTVEAAERRLRDLLVATDFGGPVWDSLAQAATEYCISIVTAWLESGHVPRPCKLDRVARAELNRSWTDIETAAIATEAATGAVAHFRNYRLARGLWRVDDGVELVEELQNGCAMTLPGMLRSQANLGRGRRAGSAATGTPGTGADAEENGRAASALRAKGYSRAVVAHVLGLSSPEAVSRAVARFRNSLETHDSGEARGNGERSGV